jgi:hypothetical protein
LINGGNVLYYPIYDINQASRNFAGFHCRVGKCKNQISGIVSLEAVVPIVVGGSMIPSYIRDFGVTHRSWGSC